MFWMRAPKLPLRNLGMNPDFHDKRAGTNHFCCQVVTNIHPGSLTIRPWKNDGWKITLNHFPFGMAIGWLIFRAMLNFQGVGLRCFQKKQDISPLRKTSSSKMYFLNNHFTSTTSSFHPPVKIIALKLYLQAWRAVASEPIKFFHGRKQWKNGDISNAWFTQDQEEEQEKYSQGIFLYKKKNNLLSATSMFYSQFATNQKFKGFTSNVHVSNATFHKFPVTQYQSIYMNNINI